MDRRSISACPAAISNPPAGQQRRDVQAEDRIWSGVLRRPVLDHRFGTPRPSGKGRVEAWTFLGRLENELHAARQLYLCMPASTSATAIKIAVCGVVAAGVHHVDLAPEILGFRLRNERKAVRLLHGQSVHVVAQSDHPTRLSSIQHRDNAGPAHASPDVKPKLSKVICNQPAVRAPAPQFRV